VRLCVATGKAFSTYRLVDGFKLWIISQNRTFLRRGPFLALYGTENVESFDKAERWMTMLCTLGRYFFAQNCLACRLIEEAAKGERSRG
jgi:hypothetical protein